VVRCRLPSFSFFSFVLNYTTSKSPNASSATLLDTPRGWLVFFILPFLLSFHYHFCLDEIGKTHRFIPSARYTSPLPCDFQLFFGIVRVLLLITTITGEGVTTSSLISITWRHALCMLAKTAKSHSEFVFEYQVRFESGACPKGYWFFLARSPACTPQSTPQPQDWGTVRT
jgi:hypothetical protein